MNRLLIYGIPSIIQKFLPPLLLCLWSLAAASQIAPSLSFKNSILISGTALQQGAVYKFPLVYPGVDAFVTVQNLLNGATITDIDQTGGVGYDDAFQPIINTISGSPNSLGRFLIEFKTTGGINYTFPVLAATGVDIDGTSLNQVEFCTINMNGGIAYFQGNTPEITVARSGTGYKATNVSGNNFTGIDTVNKSVMFTVRKSNLFSMTIDFGCVRSAGSGVRNYAVFFRDFVYPFQNVLPVKLISFGASQVNNTIHITWASSEEMNAHHFEIEKSLDGNLFESIGTVPASGNSSSILKYSYSDPMIGSNNILYYRLRMVDLDGKYTYSSVSVVRISPRESESRLITYPNPVENVLHISSPAAWLNRQAGVEIYTTSGLLVFRKITLIYSPEDLVNVSALLPASYLLVVQCNHEKVQRKFFKN